MSRPMESSLHPLGTLRVLPREIRDMIWKEALSTPSYYLSIWDLKRLKYWRNSPLLRPRPSYERRRLPCVSSWVRCEVHHVLDKKVKFVIWNNMSCGMERVEFHDPYGYVYKFDVHGPKGERHNTAEGMARVKEFPFDSVPRLETVRHITPGTHGKNWSTKSLGKPSRYWILKTLREAEKRSGFGNVQLDGCSDYFSDVWGLDGPISSLSQLDGFLAAEEKRVEPRTRDAFDIHKRGEPSQSREASTQRPPSQQPRTQRSQVFQPAPIGARVNLTQKQDQPRVGAMERFVVFLLAPRRTWQCWRRWRIVEATQGPEGTGMQYLIRDRDGSTVTATPRGPVR